MPDGDFLAQPDADWFSSVPEAYQAFLRRQGVSYLIVPWAAD